MIWYDMIWYDICISSNLLAEFITSIIFFACIHIPCEVEDEFSVCITNKHFLNVVFRFILIPKPANMKLDVLGIPFIIPYTFKSDCLNFFVLDTGFYCPYSGTYTWKQDLNIVFTWATLVQPEFRVMHVYTQIVIQNGYSAFCK